MTEISKFQKLYFKYYGKKISDEEAEEKRLALVNLLRICREVANKKNNVPI